MIFDDTMIYGTVSIDNVDKNEDNIKLNGKELKKIDEESGLKDKPDEWVVVNLNYCGKKKK